MISGSASVLRPGQMDEGFRSRKIPHVSPWRAAEPAQKNLTWAIWANPNRSQTPSRSAFDQFSIRFRSVFDPFPFCVGISPLRKKAHVAAWRPFGLLWNMPKQTHVGVCRPPQPLSTLLQSILMFCGSVLQILADCSRLQNKDPTPIRLQFQSPLSLRTPSGPPAIGCVKLMAQQNDFWYVAHVRQSMIP